MNILEIIKKRRSVREYFDKEVSEELIEKIIEAGIWAPSACNVQGWHFLVINNKERIRELAEKGIIHLRNVPAGIFILYDKRLINKEYQDHFQSAAAAIQNMYLMTSELELGSCWVCHLPSNKQLKKILNVPWYFDVIALFTLGYPKNYPPLLKRKKDLEKFISYNELKFERKILNEVKIDLLRKIINDKSFRKVLKIIPNSWREFLKQKFNSDPKI